MDAANIVLRLMAASQVLLFFGILLLSSNPLRIRVIGGLLLAGIFCYLVAPLCVDYLDFRYLFPLWYLASLAPVWLLLFVWVLFEENEPLPKWMLCLVALAMIVAFVAYLSIDLADQVDYIDVFLQCLKIIAVGLAVYIIWNGRESDLVEMRIRFRNVLTFVISAIILGVVSVELITGFVVPKAAEVFGMAVIFISSLSFNLSFIRLNPTAKLVVEPSLPVDHSDDEIIRDLLQRMRSERLYANHDIRVATLADTLQVPEYQLRKRINAKLGYRNFNQFINHYRIEEAGVRLLDNLKTPVLTIALDVGFRSISSFNTAFHKRFGVSPTQYRAESR